MVSSVERSPWRLETLVVKQLRRSLRTDEVTVEGRLMKSGSRRRGGAEGVQGLADPSRSRSSDIDTGERATDGQDKCDRHRRSVTLMQMSERHSTVPAYH
ncbi:hypothetical protein J6590_034232 [Homalodisca vitripennis]|nr:hypothetical protein J6590_034232 [Homalodisca vitripennis]